MSEQERLLLIEVSGHWTPPKGADAKTYSLPPSLLARISSRLRVLSTFVIVLVLIWWVGVNLEQPRINK